MCRNENKREKIGGQDALLSWSHANSKKARSRVAMDSPAADMEAGTQDYSHGVLGKGRRITPQSMTRRAEKRDSDLINYGLFMIRRKRMLPDY